MPFSKEVCNAFHQQAANYDSVAVVQREIGEILFERLDYLKIKPKYILDIGCGTGFFTRRLKKKYPQAMVLGIDIATGMLIEAKSHHHWLQKKPVFVRADMHQLPFQSDQFDLIFSNQVLHWSNQWPLLMREINRVMHESGCLMFSTLGPDTFLELREESQSAFAHVNTFMDMHDIGDILLKEQYLDPVVDMDKLIVHYQDFLSLLHSLKKQGVRNINSKRNPGLTGKRAWKAFQDSVKQFQTASGQYPLTYEVIYGHAWKGLKRVPTTNTEFTIPVSTLRRHHREQ